jgi:hypothetical protein
MTVLNLGSVRAEKDAVKLAHDIQKLCGGKDMTVVACALMGCVLTLPQDLATQVCRGVSLSVLAGENQHGSDKPQGE